MKKNIAVFCGSHMGRNPHFLSCAQELGTLMAHQGRTLVYGGSNCGYMGVVSTAALDAGGQAIGIIPTFFSAEVINSQPRAQMVLVGSMQERKSSMLEACDAFVALPGGIGTLDEVTEVLMSNQLQLCCKPIGLLNVDGFFNPFLQQLELMEKAGLASAVAAMHLFASSQPKELLRMLDDFATEEGR